MSQPTPEPSTNPGIAFVLSGGGSLGSVQVGMLMALYERHIRPDIIVGTSAGAINGSFIAGHPHTVEAAKELADIWRGLRRSDVFPIQVGNGLLGFVGRRQSLISADRLKTLIKRNLTFQRLEDASTPFHVIVTDLVSGCDLRISEGDALQAVMASAAIPGVFPPIQWRGTQLVDGGVSNNTPISHMIELGARKIYVLPTGNSCALPQPPRSALGVMIHSMLLLIMQRLIIEIEMHKDNPDLIVLPPPCPLNVSPIDFSRAEEMIRTSRRDTHKYLDELEAGQTTAPISMVMHNHKH